ncbi:RHS repeat-associated core domain-containing protein [Photorhabdus asymbiotica]|uniref:RHS repeat-associated core domain-containing protein n=1 Tax=Photorhabdus asymbiotica TaxID=291112 RepID=UPI003DA7A640
MGTLQNVWVGAGSAQRSPAAEPQKIAPDTHKTLIKPSPPPPRTAKTASDNVLDFLESNTLSNVSMAMAGAYAVATGTIAPFAVGLGAGMVGAYVGGYVGEKVGHQVADFLGMQTVATEGDAPARLGDVIAHQNKSAGAWGTLGGILLGAVAVVAAAAFVVATAGTGAVILAAAAAGLAGGFVGGVVGGIGAAIGQYGQNKGAIIEGSPNVFFEGQPVARAGDKILCSNHPRPMVIAEGAKTVFANGKPIARLGHRTTCDANINSAAASIAITRETEGVYDIMESSNKPLRWAVAIAGLIPLPRRKNTGKNQEAKPSVKKRGCSHKSCGQAGEPVDVATGDFLQVWPVLSLPGFLPLALNRVYRSTANFSGLFGPKWADDWSQHLKRDGEETHFTDGEGVIYTFHTPTEAVFSVNLHAGHYLLYGQRSGALHLFNRQTQQILSFAKGQGDKHCLSTIEDRNGNQMVFRYDEVGRLTDIGRSDGTELVLHYEQQLTAIDWLHQGQRQRLVSCRYDTHGFLAECQSFQFFHLWHEYSPQGYMTRWHDTEKTDFTLRYDTAGRVISTATPQGYWQDRFIYDDAEKVTTYLDAEGGKSRYWYNADGLVTRQIDPLGNETLSVWDFSHKVSETDPLGRTVANEYSPYGELIAVTNPAGESTAYGYDEYGQLAQVKQPDGGIWGYHYNDRGNLDAVTDPQGRREDYRYGPHGEILRHVLPDGRQWYYGYQRQRLSEVVAPNGCATQFEFDGLGRLLTVTDELNQQTRYHHSSLHASPAGSVSEICLPDGVRQTIDYDSERQVSAVMDGQGRVTRYNYGAFDLLSGITRPDGTTVTFAYDKLTQLIAVTGATGETYRYVRDRAGRIISETDFSGRTLQYQYDRAGRRIITRYPDNQLLRWCYSVEDWVKRQEIWQEEDKQCQLLEVTEYAYDSKGRLMRATNPDVAVEFEYDPFGNLTTEKINGRTVAQQWDPLSGLPTRHQVDGVPGLNWEYGALGLVTYFRLDGHKPLYIQHDGLGRQTVRENEVGFIQSQYYTSTGLLSHQSAGCSSAMFRQALQEADPHHPPFGSVVNRRWHYDRAYNVACIEDSRWEQTRYGYNANDQVVEALFSGTPSAREETFRYDANQNISYCRQIPEWPSKPIHQAYQEQQDGRVVRHGENEYRYDENGRMVEKIVHKYGFQPRTFRYCWDAYNQLTEFITPEGTRWRYRYDAFGRRISKRKEVDAMLEATNLQRWFDGLPDLEMKPTAVIGYDYLWSGDQLIAETPVYANGTVAYEESIHWLYEPEELTPTARYEKGKLHYVVSDHQGTVREILTEEGKLAWAGRLFTWGDLEFWGVSSRKAETVSCNLRFVGQYEDEESGLFYNRFRYYNPETAQYLTPDPIGLEGGFNPYGYVHNPLTWVDPLGLCRFKRSTSRLSFNPRGSFLGFPSTSSSNTSRLSFNPRRSFLVSTPQQSAWYSTKCKSGLDKANNDTIIRREAGSKIKRAIKPLELAECPKLPNGKTVNEFERTLAYLPTEERWYFIREMAESVAKANDWKRARNIEKLNKGRVIYEDKDGKYYYSVDMQHGRFEKIAKKLGNHLGEVDMMLTNIPNSIDKSGGHNLKVK